MKAGMAACMCIFFVTLMMSAPASGVTFVVDSEKDGADAVPGDGVCATQAGECTLRAAFQETIALQGEHTIVVLSSSFSIGSAKERDVESQVPDTSVMQHNDPAGASEHVIVDKSEKPAPGETSLASPGKTENNEDAGFNAAGIAIVADDSSPEETTESVIDFNSASEDE